MQKRLLPAETHIGAVHITISDLDRSLAFYEELLGLQAHTGDNGSLALSAQEGRTLLVLHESQHALVKPPRSTGLYHFAILLPTRSDLAWTLARLLAFDYPLQGASDHGVSEAVYLADPDGNGIEIYADRPRARCYGADGRLHNGHRPSGLRRFGGRAR